MDWKKELKQLKYEHIKKTSPGFFEASGGRTMKLAPYGDGSSNQLTKAITDFLKFKGHTVSTVKSSCQVRKEKVEFALGNYRNLVKISHSTPIIKAVIAGRSVMFTVRAKSSDTTEEGLTIELFHNADSFPGFHEWYKRVFENVPAQMPV